jgi:hypothetical protein
MNLSGMFFKFLIIIKNPVARLALKHFIDMNIYLMTCKFFRIYKNHSTHIAFVGLWVHIYYIILKYVVKIIFQYSVYLINFGLAFSNRVYIIISHWASLL